VFHCDALLGNYFLFQEELLEVLVAEGTLGLRVLATFSTPRALGQAIAPLGCDRRELGASGSRRPRSPERPQLSSHSSPPLQVPTIWYLDARTGGGLDGRKRRDHDLPSTDRLMAAAMPSRLVGGLLGVGRLMPEGNVTEGSNWITRPVWWRPMLVKGSRRSKNGDGKGFRDVWPRCRPEPCCKFSLMGQQSDGPLDPLVSGGRGCCSGRPTSTPHDGPSSARSTSARTVSSTPARRISDEALIWAGVRAPTNALVISGLATTQAVTNWPTVQPRAAASGWSSSTARSAAGRSSRG